MPIKDKQKRLAWQREYDAKHKKQKRDYGLRTAAQAKARWVNGYHRNTARAMLQAAKSRAKQKGLTFSITEADILVPEACPLLGIPLAASREARAPGSPSLDRKDARKGYEPGNVWVISYRANRIKNDATVHEFLTMAANLECSLGSEGTVAKKQKIAQPRAALEAKVKKLQAENRSLRARVRELEAVETAPAGWLTGDHVRVEVGPLDDLAQPRMPWDDALPNGFAEDHK